MSITNVNLGFLGFGNVLRALAQLLVDKSETIQQDYGLDLKVTGIATRSRGIAIAPDGLDLRQALASDDLNRFHVGKPIADVFEFIRQCPASIIVEATVVNPQTGQPATDYCSAALEAGKSVVTANKGPVAFAQRELSGLAQKNGLAFFYESTVLDGAPLHSLRREGLLASEVKSIRGILNSTTNSILSRMRDGISFDEAVREMQAAGTAETDPSNDIDGWDAAIKIAILANTMMGADLRPTDVDRIGIRAVTPEEVQAGQTLKLLCEAFRDEQNHVQARVQPQLLPTNDPLALLEGASSGVMIETDIFERIWLTKSPSSPRSTAYGMLVDVLNIARGRR